MGTATRGACKICGQTGHLTKQCRNALPGGGGEGGGGAAEAAAMLEAPPADDGADSLDLSSDSSDEERRRCVLCISWGRSAPACPGLGL